VDRQSNSQGKLIPIEVVLLMFVFVSASTFAQVESVPKLHTPAEIMKIMENSELTYEIGGDYIVPLPDSPVVLSNQMFLREKEGGYSLETYSLSDQTRQVLQEGEEAFHNEDFGKAMTLYQQLLEVQPEYFHALTLIGDAYFSIGQFDSAKSWFSRSIELNFADYNAHWFLADTYEKLNNMEAAADEATIAHLLNVNHSNLRKAVRYYRERTNHPWKEWVFDPQYALSKDGNEVTIKTTAEWLGYALVKAAWAYEPGYAQSMLGNQKDKLVVVWPEEKEAIMAVLASNEKLSHINDIIDKGFFTEFILYEVTAKMKPSILVLLPREMFARMVEYVNTFH